MNRNIRLIALFAFLLLPAYALSYGTLSKADKLMKIDFLWKNNLTGQGVSVSVAVIDYEWDGNQEPHKQFASKLLP